MEETAMKLKIAHVVTLISPDGSYGGPVRVAVNQAKELLKLGHEVVIYGTYSGFKTAPTHIEGVPAKLYRARNLVPGRGFAGTFSGALLRRFAVDVRAYDLVHVHMARDLVTMPAAVIAKMTGTPYVLQTHGMIDGSSKPMAVPLDAALTRPLLRGASCVFHLTQTELAQLKEVARTPIRLQELHNAVPQAEPTVTLPTSTEVLYLARLQSRKQPALFAQVAAALLRKGVKAHFSMVGPDEGEALHISEIIADFDPGQLLWEGALAPEFTLDRMRKASLYVLPSVDEPFPMSVLEAISVGVPVIITNTCGLARAIEGAKAGLVIEPDFQQLAEAITQLVENHELRNEMGANARRLANDSFSMDVIAKRLVETYHRSVSASV
ncbi:UNVERIFIED_ORG: glycosyltransferase involved in cell wall biosynthesis [Arthrobacter globiformis]|nr:glycosyltransferase involved in cell wall biosynthesis [Arthrobacter globiformis]